jgi:hypothetical protein
VDPTADTTIEVDETVALTLAAGSGYTIGTTSPVVGTIEDDDVQVEGAGGVKLLRDGNQRLSVQIGSAAPVKILYGGTQVFQGMFSGWETLGAESVGGVNYLTWKNVAGNYLHQWTLDENWNYVSSQGQWGMNSFEGMEQESKFGQDFNRDGVTGQVYELVESAGGVKMVKDGNQRFYAQIASAAPVKILYGGTQVFQGMFSGWETLGAESVGGVNHLMWKNVAGNYLHQWTLDGNWNLVSSQGAWGMQSLEGLAQESRFGQDFNGDGVIGSPT